MIDPHWYVDPDFFFDNAHIFDTLPRGKYDIYVGEYACNRKVGVGNMLAALSEAAFITGTERNSDLVKMASYAPLLENFNDRTWPVNLIWIDNMQVVGRSSYYVQKVMAENKPTYNLKTVIIPRAVSKSEPKAGSSFADSLRQFSVGGYDETTGELIVKVVNAENHGTQESQSIKAAGLQGMGR